MIGAFRRAQLQPLWAALRHGFGKCFPFNVSKNGRFPITVNFPPLRAGGEEKASPRLRLRLTGRQPPPRPASSKAFPLRSDCWLQDICQRRDLPQRGHLTFSGPYMEVPWLYTKPGKATLLLALSLPAGTS